MKPVLLLLYLLACIAASAKDNDTTHTPKYVAIKWNIGGMMHPYAPPIILGVEKRWHAKYSTTLQFGMPLPIQYPGGRNHGFNIRGDIKYFRRKSNKKNTEPFLGLEAFYINHTYSTSGYADTLRRTTFQNDTLVFSQRMFGMALITGAQRKIGRHVMLQLYFGAGFKVKNVNQLSAKLPGQHTSNRHDIVAEATNETGAYAALAVPFHFSISYYFNPKK
jgi:hypothetical protein